MKNLTQDSIKAQVKRTPRLNDLHKSIRKDLEEVENQLKIFASSKNQIISDISTYLFQKAGKRIRPSLLILCSRLMGYRGKEHILMGCLVETIHTASLIHDDIIDNSDTRRGRESVHAKWGPNITVLMGDYLYIKTIGLSLKSQHKQIVRVITDTSARMIEGELNEYSLSGSLDMKERDYLDIINKKTASLFSASCRIGGILGNASEEEESTLAKIGTNLGMSFQIIDDLLDYTGDEKTLGKPILSDLRERRITLPLIYTLNNDGQANRKRLDALLKEDSYSNESLKEILDIIESNGALDYTFEKAQEFSGKSKQLIQKFPSSPYREALSLFTDFILCRKK
jgi:octaprenyl-diphosphate synthase